jgi:hypothetical protein
MPSFKKKMDSQRLRNSEMKKLVQLLRGVPLPHYAGTIDTYPDITKEAIKRLPRRLRRSALLNLSTSTGGLCSMHKNLDHHLMDDLLDWVKHEFSAIGKLLYPLLMSSKLTYSEASKARQLEPVLEIWRRNFDIEKSAPPGCAPITRTNKWTYQADHCPACMLARIGSDDDVLRALYAGMIARFSTDKCMSRRIVLAELGVHHFDNPKSKRVRFVRYWVKACSSGDTLLFEAVELGLKLKRLNNEYKTARKVSIYESSLHLDGETLFGSTHSDPFWDSSEVTERPRTALYVGHQSTPAQNPFHDEHARPQTSSSSCYSQPAQTPHPFTFDDGAPLDPRAVQTPSSSIDFTMPHRKHTASESSRPMLDSTPQRHPSSSRSNSDGSDDTVRPSDSVSSAAYPAPLRLFKRTRSHALRAGPKTTRIPSYPSVHDNASILYDLCPAPGPTLSKRCSKPPRAPSSIIPGPPSRRPCTPSPPSTILSYDVPAALPAHSSKNKVFLIAPRALPLPDQQSMYFGYDTADDSYDPFEEVDRDVDEADGDDEWEEEVASPTRGSGVAK